MSDETPKPQFPVNGMLLNQMLQHHDGRLTHATNESMESLAHGNDLPVEGAMALYLALEVQKRRAATYLGVHGFGPDALAILEQQLTVAMKPRDDGTFTMSQPALVV